MTVTLLSGSTLAAGQSTCVYWLSAVLLLLLLLLLLTPGKICVRSCLFIFCLCEIRMTLVVDGTGWNVLDGKIFVAELRPVGLEYSVGNIEGICGGDCQSCCGYCWQGVDGKYIHVLPLTDGHSPREFRIDASVGMHTSVTAFLACQWVFLPSPSSYAFVHHTSRTVTDKNDSRQKTT